MVQQSHDGFEPSSFRCIIPFGRRGFSARCLCAAACRSASARKATVCSFTIACTAANTSLAGKPRRAAAILAA